MAAKKSSKKTRSTAAAAKSAKAGKPAKSAKTGGTDTLVLTAISPSFTVSDVETSLTWYRDVLGFTVAERWERDGKLMGAGLSSGKAFLMLGQDDWKKGRDRVKGQGVRMYCETGQDIDRLAAKIKARGGRLSQEPMDHEWGMRDIAIEDPDGYKITIAKQLKKKR